MTTTEPGRAAGRGPAGTALDGASVLTAGGSAGAFEWDVPDGWQQGRGAYGGLVLAGLLRAVEVTDPAGRPLRAVTAQIVAPLPVGRARIRVEPVRLGSAVSTYTAAVRPVDATEDAARSVVVLGATRDLDPPLGAWAADHGEPPAAPPWEAVPVVPLGAPIAPVFLQHVEVRPVRGLPTVGDGTEVVAWIRFAGHGPDVDYDAVGVVALVDAVWPTALVAMDRPRPLATVTFDASVLVDPHDLDPTAPLLFRGRWLAGHDGYLREDRTLWSPDGRLVVHNVQTLVVIR